jgi:hypothetical protein
LLAESVGLFFYRIRYFFYSLWSNGTQSSIERAADRGFREKSATGREGSYCLVVVKQRAAWGNAVNPANPMQQVALVGKAGARCDFS